MGQSQVVVKKVGDRMESVTPTAVSTATSHNGAQINAKGVKTETNKDARNSVNQGNQNTTVNGDSGSVVTGMRNPVSESSQEVIGSFKLFNSGNAQAANQIVGRVAAVAAQQGNDKQDSFSVSTMLGNISKSITGVTRSIDTVSDPSFQPTGDVLKDLTGLVQYYQKMLMEFTIKNTTKRILLAIQSEVEKLKIQFEQTEKLLKSIPKRWDELKRRISKNPMAALSAPSRENQQGSKTLTKKEAAKPVIKHAAEDLEKARNV